MNMGRGRNMARATFLVHRSSFPVHRSSFPVHRSSFIVHRSEVTSLDVQNLLAQYRSLEVLSGAWLWSDPGGEDRVGGRFARQSSLHLAVHFDGRSGSRHIGQDEAIAFRD